MFRANGECKTEMGPLKDGMLLSFLVHLLEMEAFE